MRYVLAVVAFLGGCASVQQPAPVSDSLPAPLPDAVPAPLPDAAPAVPDSGTAPLPDSVPGPVAALPAVPANSAVASLVTSARADAAAGRLTNAAASLERALRIEPRNPRLWQELARVRLKQGDYVQAESTAARSNSWAGGDSRLRSENWRLIAQAREARGDAAGARAALDAAERQR
jgi:tetratricopeptide repeat protein